MQGTVAGVIGALIASAILFCVAYTHDWLEEQQDVRYIREILIDGRKYIMGAKDTNHPDMFISAGALRVANYNTMIKRLDVAFEKWTVNLSHDKRKDIFDALNWYNTELIPVKNIDGIAEFPELPDGKWVFSEMSIEVAKEKFEKLQSIEWLELEPY